jgi:hypothetical protein
VLDLANLTKRKETKIAKVVGNDVDEERFPMKNVGKGDAGKSDGAGAPKLFWRGEASKSYGLKVV